MRAARRRRVQLLFGAAVPAAYALTFLLSPARLGAFGVAAGLARSAP